jgi:hypothetical protein
MAVQAVPLVCELSEESLRLHASSTALMGSKPNAALPSTALPSPAPSDDSQSEIDFIGDAQRTTLIVRQTPREITRRRVMHALGEQGFGGDFDFLYCPLDYVSQKGFGYVLLNFTSPGAAGRFREKFHARPGSWLVAGHASALDIVWAIGENRQGLQANIERYRNSPVMHGIVPDEFKPIVLTRGRRVAFGRPTQKLEAPSKLPRAVWKAWTAGKKSGSLSAHEMDTSCAGHSLTACQIPAEVGTAAKTPAGTLSMSAQLYCDHRFKFAFHLPLGFRCPPGLPQPVHLQFL